MPGFFPASLRAGMAALLLTVCGAEEVKIHPGKRIYDQQCADCHGSKGEGVAGKYDEPLAGNRPMPSLTRYISRTMPEEDPDACVGEDAEQVAAYIFDAFYSPAAQARNNPVRESLARLTATQYQQSVADLIGLFRGGSNRPPGTARGFKAHYTGKRTEVYGPHLPAKDNEDKRRERERFRFDRIDSRVAFHFGSDSPIPDIMKPEEFNIRWEGSIYPRETGTYEFVVRTENGFRLWVNHQRDPVIDAWVSSGPDVREERRSIFLLGGRSYPIKLEYFKYREKSASIELLWRAPHGKEEVLSEDAVEPQGSPETIVVGARFPADDRSDGYERGTTISKEWDQATTQAALEVAAHVEANLDSLAGTKPKAEDRVDKLKAFARRFLDAALRRPVDDTLFGAVVEKSFTEAPTPEIAIKRVVLFGLKSPRFLYPELAHPEEVDGYTLASRLALTLWDSIPDEPLMRAAREGRLQERQQVAGEIQRMLRDPRARTKIRGFFAHWLELERAEIASKDAGLFPGFDESMMAELRESLWRFVDEVVWSEASDYRQLLEANYLWLNERLAHYYGREPNGPGFQKIEFKSSERAGVVTHPYLLAALSYHRTTSPIHRGVFLSRNIAGLALKNPSVAVAFEEAKFDPSLTMREKVIELTKDQSCMGCHSTINPLGFSLENFDAVGRWRAMDNGKPVDAIGEFETDDGRTVRLSGPRDVAAYAASSEAAHRAFVRQLFHHLVKQPVPAFGEDTLDILKHQFSSSGFSIQKLAAEIAMTHALPRASSPPPLAAQAHDR